MPVPTAGAVGNPLRQLAQQGTMRLLHSQAAALLPVSQRLCLAATLAHFKCDPYRTSSVRSSPAAESSWVQFRARRACVTSAACGQASFSGNVGADGACTFQKCNKDESDCETLKPHSLAARLQSYGFAGVASYGLLNTAYYIIAFIFFWTRIAKVPKGLGLAEAAKQFVGVMSLTWAGSQVTKVARVAAAVTMAPLLDAACSQAQQQLGLRSRNTALSFIVALCVGAAALCFGGTVLLWA